MGRIHALAAAHDLLTRSRWSGASVEDLVSAELAPFNRLKADRIVWTGGPMALTPRQALGLGMVIHELATNAVKHGALSVPGGHVAIQWRPLPAAQPEQLEFLWIERDGPRVDPPTRAGFGTRLTQQTVSTDLEGTLRSSFDPVGLQCTIQIPLTASSIQDR